MKKSKAIIINNLTAGGAEKVVLTLLAEFHKNDEPMHLICIGREQYYDLPDYLKVHYLTNLPDLPSGILKIFYLFKCAFLLKKIAKENQIELIQGHLLSSNFVSILARVLGATFSIQLVNHCQINFDKKSWFKKAFSKFWFRWMFLKIDTIISISKVMKKDLETYLNIEAHPHHIVIPNPHPVDEIKHLSEALIEDFFFNENKKYLITASRLHERKQIGTILKAYDQLKERFNNLELLIVGDGPQKEEYELLAQKMGLEKVVHFLGYKSNPFNYIKHADLFVMSSRMEGLPNIIIESMICGTPVISSDCISGPREILNPNSNLDTLIKDEIEYGEYGVLFPIGRADLLAKAVEHCLNNPSILKTYQEKGTNRINTYDAKRIIQKYLATFPNQKIPNPLHLVMTKF